MVNSEFDAVQDTAVNDAVGLFNFLILLMGVDSMSSSDIIAVFEDVTFGVHFCS
jgi:hypothetical protein